MPPIAQPELRIALTFLRLCQGWSQAGLGKAADISPSLLNDYERGRKKLSRDRLAHILAFMGLPPESIDSTLAALAPTGPQGKRRRIRPAAGRRHPARSRPSPSGSGMP